MPATRAPSWALTASAIQQTMSAMRASTDAAQAEAVRWPSALGSCYRPLMLAAARVRAQAAIKGVQLFRGRFTAKVKFGGNTTQLAVCDTAEEAARAYDDAVRKAGGRVVNFPRVGTLEVQAVKGEEDRVTLQKAGEGPARRSGPLPTLAKHFKGVSVAPKATTAAVYAAEINVDSMHTHLGSFCTEEEAARAYDDAARKAGRRVVNFPRAGTNEVQAVKGEDERITLARHATPQSSPGAGSGAAASLRVIASPPPKRSAASKPELSVKRAAAHRFGSAGGSAADTHPPQPKREVDADAVPAGITAPAQPRARHAASKRGAAESPAPIARPPRNEPADAPPPTKKQRLDERAPAGIKLETPSPVKLETSAAVKLERPAAPAARLPRALPVDEPADTSPAKKQRSEKHAPANIKLEPPTAVKLETPAAPALPAVSAFGLSSPFAAPVKTEDEAAVAAVLPGVPPPLWDFYAAL